MDETSRIFERARQGDPDAFGRLADAHYRSIYGIAFSTLGNWSAAQDIAQETFLLAWLHKAGLRDAVAFPAWLRRIAVNLSKNWIRSTDYRRRLALHYRALANTEIPAGQNAVDTDSQAWRREQVWHALESLSPANREAVVLYYMHGESLRVVAESLGISENTAKKRLQHGRAKLRAHFEELWKQEMAQAGSATGAHSARERFLAGLLVGPAVPEIGKAMVPAGLQLAWLNASATGAIPAFIGVMAMTAKQGIAAAAVVALAASGLWLFSHRSMNDPETTPTARETVRETIPSTPVSDVPEQATPEVALESTPPAPEKEQTDAETLLATARVVDEEPKNVLSLRGRVVNGSDTPIAGASLILMRTGTRAPTEGADADALRTKLAEYEKDVVKRGVIWSGLTDDTGNFKIDGLPIGGTAILVARAPGFKSDSAMIYFEGNPQSKEEITIRLTPGITVSGILLNADGIPVADAQVEVCGISTDTGSSGTSDGLYAWTDSQGRFELDIESAGWLSLRVNSATEGAVTFDRMRVDLEDKLILRYPKDTTVFGTVRDAQGSAVSNVEVRFTGSIVSESYNSDGTVGGSSMRSGDKFSTLTDAGGAYRIEKFDPGQRYTSEVLGVDGEPITSGPGILNLVPGTQHELNFVVNQPMILQGTIIGNATNRPVAGMDRNDIHESYIQSNSGAAPRKHNSTSSGPDGRYSLKITGEAGRFGLMTSWTESSFSWDRRTMPFVKVSVRQGETVTQDLHVDEFATRAFLVVDEKGAPIANAHLSMIAQSETFGMGYGLELHTGADGRVVVTKVPSNVSTEIAFAAEGYFTGKSRAITAEPAANLPEEIVVMYREARVRLTAIDSSGNPFVGRTVEVELDYGADGCSSAFITDEYGAGITGDAFPAMNASLRLWLRPGDDGSPRLDAELLDVTLVEGENDLGQIVFVP